MSPMGFEPTISAGERPKTYALDRAATGTGTIIIIIIIIIIIVVVEERRLRVYENRILKRIFRP